MSPPATATTQSNKLLLEEAELFRFCEKSGALHILAPTTPQPWRNYLFNDDCYMEIDQCAQGRIKITDGKLRTRRGSYRHFFLRDESTGLAWNLSNILASENIGSYDFEAIHHLSHSEFHVSYNGIESTLTVVLPKSGIQEIWSVSVKNTTEHHKKLSLFSAFPFDDSPLMKGKSWYDSSSGICLASHFPHHHQFDDYEQLKSQKTTNYLFSTELPIGGESGEDNFFGSSNETAIPEAIKRGYLLGEPCVMNLPIGALHHNLSIGSNETRDIGLCFGIDSSVTNVQCLEKKFSYETFETALASSKALYQTVTTKTVIQTPDKAFDLFVNTWLHKQVLFQSKKNRLAGAFPIRNQLQDCMGYALLDPTAAGSYLLSRAQLQNENGYLRQWWAEGDSDQHSLCKLDFKDAGIWLILCSLIVSHQTGSLKLLKTPISFVDSVEKESLFEHLMRAARCLADQRGQHGLCLFGDGDWTDPINGAGRKGIGESTWTTCALGFAVQLLQEAAIELNESEAATWLKKLDDSLKISVERHCWDGDWFVTGYNDEGKAFGGNKDEEGKIFLNSQTWAIIAGYVSNERLDPTIDSIKKLETPAGSLLSWPAFTKWNPTWGRITLKQAGTTENGSIYCHASMFKAFAELQVGQRDSAFSEITRILPHNPRNPPSHNQQPPTFLPNYYFGQIDSPEFGQSSCHHHTGTAPWMLWLVIEHVFGIRATHRGLQIDPKLPSHWNTVSVKRNFKSSRYNITIERKGLTSPTISIDGTICAIGVLPSEKAHYDVLVSI